CFSDVTWLQSSIAHTYILSLHDALPISGLSVAIDVGRPWWIWKVPLFFWQWNLNSVLLEVALCIMAYMLVLWIELSPAFFEAWKDRKSTRLNSSHVSISYAVFCLKKIKT